MNKPKYQSKDIKEYENIIIKFGKYKNKNMTIKDIYDSDLNWCLWYLKMSQKLKPEDEELITPTIRAIIKYINHRKENNI